MDAFIDQSNGIVSVGNTMGIRLRSSHSVPIPMPFPDVIAKSAPIGKIPALINCQSIANKILTKVLTTHAPPIILEPSLLNYFWTANLL
jgi:hypothetical protein